MFLIKWKKRNAHLYCSSCLNYLLYWVNTFRRRLAAIQADCFLINFMNYRVAKIMTLPYNKRTKIENIIRWTFFSYCNLRICNAANIKWQIGVKAEKQFNPKITWAKRNDLTINKIAVQSCPVRSYTLEGVSVRVKIMWRGCHTTNCINLQ